jgi:peptide/nickel transport system permease protein
MATDTSEKYNAKKSILRSLRYISQRFVTIALTIIIGVFLTVILVNRTGQLDYSIEKQINQQVNRMMWSGGWSNLSVEERGKARDELEAELLAESHLDDPFLIKHLRYTFKALVLDWGEVLWPAANSTLSSGIDSLEIREIINNRLPNTLLLMGTAYLLLFLTGIPIALMLSRQNESFLDKLFTFLSPLSSIPSWVHGILLVLFIGVAVEWLPIDGMVDPQPPEQKIGYILVVMKHMILPVSAILLSMYFQLIYTWRTYFLLFSEEAYVELAVAQGLNNSKLNNKYILKPGLPYVLTSFAVTLVGFWQTSTALEVIFRWPGIGYTYVRSLPHFFGESMYQGELLITIAIVVVFAYLLGAVIFSLDILNLIIDPRIRIANQETPQIRIRTRKQRQQHRHNQAKRRSKRIKARIPLTWSRLKYHWRIFREAIQRFFHQLWKYPSAIFGFTIILFFIFGSLYAVVFYPYKTAGLEWNSSSFTGKISVPRTAQPKWVNWFRKNDLPETIFMTSNDPEVTQVDSMVGNNHSSVFTYTFIYPYTGAIPQEVLLYMYAEYEEKFPFATISWATPDGRIINFPGGAIKSTSPYMLSENLSTRKMLLKNPEWEKWFEINPSGNNTSPIWMLFAPPNSTEQVIQPGRYHLRVEVLFFEENNDIEMEIVMPGEVYGMAGTDMMRRDLMFPLLWGMPFVILLGLFGATITTVLALIVAAIGVWYGGWVDTIIQRITEANMILPILAISILVHVIFGVDMLVIIGMVIIMNVFSTPTKIFRSAFMQIKDAPYIEAARVYGASNIQLIFRYMIPRIIPVIIPQLVILIPSYVFLEATFGLFNIRSLYPTWGRVIYEALQSGAAYGSKYWVLEPLALLLLTSFAFTLLGSVLDKVLNPKLNKG